MIVANYICYYEAIRIEKSTALQCFVNATIEIKAIPVSAMNNNLSSAAIPESLYLA